MSTTRIGLLLFPQLTQLDLTGPAEVFARMPGVELHLIWKTRDPVPSDRTLTIIPTTTFAECPVLDLICVPGGPGQVALMEDDETLDFLRRIAATCPRSTTATCAAAAIPRTARNTKR